MDELKIKVLLMEENPDGPAYWDGVLARIGDPQIEYTHLQTLSGPVQALGKGLPDVIVLDLTMGEAPGIKHFLNVQRSAPDVPIIVVTGNDNQKLAIQTMQEGARDCLSKSEVEGQSLSRSLRNAIWHQLHLRQLRVFSVVGEMTDPENRKVLLAQAGQKLKMASRARQELLRKTKMAALEETAARLSKDPDDIEAYLYRGRLLMELGRQEEAQEAYLEILNRAPARFGGVNEPGSILLAACREAVLRHPENPLGHVTLGNILREKGEREAALAEYEKALEIQPDWEAALQGKGLLLRNGLKETAGVPVASHREVSQPIPTILLMSAAEGNAPFERFLDNRTFKVSVIVTEFYDPSYVLPAHRLVVNAIGDSELCGPALKAAQTILARTTAPVVNPPTSVMATGRANNAVRLAKVSGVITPTTIELSREVLANPGGEAAIAALGFTFPLLLRLPGYHVGRYFQLVGDKGELASAAAGLPGDKLLVIQFLDSRGADGNIRKYRVMTIDGKFYPAHLAVSRDWKVHYFSADMADNPGHRAEDEAFLGDMRAVIRDRAFQALEGIRDRLALDYAGIDFGLDPRGNVILYEANAYMNIPPPDPDERWNYRRGAVTNIMEAARRMLVERALKAEG